MGVGDVRGTLCAYHFNGTLGRVTLLYDLYLYWDALTKFLHVADDAHVPSRLRVEGVERVDGVLQWLAAQRAEALVDEQGVDGKPCADV